MVEEDGGDWEHYGRITSRNGQKYHIMTVSEWHKIETDGNPWQPTSWLHMAHNDDAVYIYIFVFIKIDNTIIADIWALHGKVLYYQTIIIDRHRRLIMSQSKLEYEEVRQVPIKHAGSYYFVAIWERSSAKCDIMSRNDLCPKNATWKFKDNVVVKCSWHMRRTKWQCSQ